MNGKTQKKGFHMPHVFIILLVIMLFVVLLSYMIPSGSYERIEDSSGITVIDPDTFQYVENETPITFMDYFEAIYTGFVNGTTIMGTLFISSGVIYLLEVSGAFGAGINMILKKTKGREFSVVCIFYTIFVVFGVLGYGEAAYPFYPLAVTIGFALGYDRMVGTALAIVGSTVGFTSGPHGIHLRQGVGAADRRTSTVFRYRVPRGRSGRILYYRSHRIIYILPEDQEKSHSQSDE